MSDKPDIQRVLDRWFEAGATSVPDRVLDRALETIDQTRQRRAWSVSWRNLTMSNVARIAVAGVLILAVGAAAYFLSGLEGGPRTGTSSESPQSSASGQPSPSASPSTAVISPQAAAWTATGAMAKPRNGHKATLLPDGRVLVVDDYIDDNAAPQSSAELYDPSTGEWASTGSMVAPRSGYAVASLADGKVLVAGGASRNGGASAEVYDPISGTWTATGPMAAARSYHTLTLLRDGKVLAAGGIAADLPMPDGQAFAELYDPVGGTWTATGAMAADRFYHTATLLLDGKVLVAGGSQDGVPNGPSAELYDPISGTWTAAGNMITPTPRSGHTATLLPDGKVLVAGGVHGINHSIEPVTSAELYDPQSGAWSATQALIEPRSGHTATLLPDGRVLVAGGMTSALTSASGGHELLASAELYDPARGTWSATASMVATRGGQTATLLPDGRVLVVGVFNSDGESLASAELYDPGSGN